MSEVMPAAPDDLLKHTYNVLIDLWLNNIAENLPLIRNGKPLEALPKKTGEPCIALAGGPSVARHCHLELIQKMGWNHPVLCCDRTFKKALDHNIMPYVVASVDGNPVIAKYYNHKIVRKLSKQMNAAFNVMVHPNVVKSWKGQIYWFLNMIDSVQAEDGKINNRSVTYILHVLSKRTSLISTIGNVGSFLWNVGCALECEPIILVGYDFSEQVKYKDKAVYFKSFVEMYKQRFDEKTAMDKAADLHQVEKNPDFNNYYLVNPIWKSYRELFAKHITTSGRTTINSTGNGCLHTEAKNDEGEFILKCDNFEAMSLKRAIMKYGLH